MEGGVEKGKVSQRFEISSYFFRVVWGGGEGKTLFFFFTSLFRIPKNLTGRTRALMFVIGPYSVQQSALGGGEGWSYCLIRYKNRDNFPDW